MRAVKDFSPVFGTLAAFSPLLGPVPVFFFNNSQQFSFFFASRRRFREFLLGSSFGVFADGSASREILLCARTLRKRTRCCSVAPRCVTEKS